MAKILYKGEEREIKIDNKSMMRFEMNGGSLSDFESKPVSCAVNLACACLDLEGDPLDHANDLPPLSDIAEAVKSAMEESGLNGVDVSPKKEDG
tara:strand:+ start:313 stop:594 length:282 start_codon:yes stop_codon:yes gene_type:complete